MAETLPPFSGDTPACPKCSSTTGAYTEYKASGESRSGSVSQGEMPERLERRCVRCNFGWDEAINPPGQDSP